MSRKLVTRSALIAVIVAVSACIGSILLKSANHDRQ